MSEIVNLRQVRKSRKRQVAADAAAENRVRFGRTLAQRRIEAEAEDRLNRTLDGAKRTLARDPEAS